LYDTFFTDCSSTAHCGCAFLLYSNRDFIIYFWDAVVDITVDPDLTKGSDSFFVYSMAHISLNDIIAEENTSPGDINSDGKVDLTDLSELSLAIIGDRTLTEKQIEAADINENGEADLPDLARLKQYLSKVITSLR